MDFFGNVSKEAVGFYNFIISNVPSWLVASIQVFLLALMIVLISLFIWGLYKTVSKKNFFKLSLNKYNTSNHESINKFFAVIIYILENVLIMPFLILLWFLGLSIILLILSQQKSIDQIILLSAGVILAVRLLAYANHSLAEDVSKLFPFIALSVFLLSPESLDIGSVLLQISKIPALMNDIIYYLIFVFIVEALLRIFTSFQFLFDNLSGKFK